MPTEAANLDPGDLTVTYTVAVTIPGASVAGGTDPGPLMSAVPGALVAAVASQCPSGVSPQVTMAMSGSLGFDVIESPES